MRFPVSVDVIGTSSMFNGTAEDLIELGQPLAVISSPCEVSGSWPQVQGSSSSTRLIG
jgi:hypothetical protein